VKSAEDPVLAETQTICSLTPMSIKADGSGLEGGYTAVSQGCSAFLGGAMHPQGHLAPAHRLLY
jgi:hypothetical protein